MEVLIKNSGNFSNPVCHVSKSLKVNIEIEKIYVGFFFLNVGVPKSATEPQKTTFVLQVKKTAALDMLRAAP